MWMRKTEGAKLSAKPPLLKTLPPTDEALELNIKRAHFAASMMKCCVTGKLPNMNPCEYGWELDTDEVSLKPTMLPDGVEITPKAVLQTTRCNCNTSKCRTNKCSCAKARIPCSDFCGCSKSDTDDCENRWGIMDEVEEVEGQEDEVDDQDKTDEEEEQ